MSHYAQLGRITPPTSALSIEGVAVPQPISLVEAELATRLVQRKEIQNKIDSSEADDETILRHHERELVQNERNVERYANPLHAFAPHLYPAVSHYL